MAINNASIGDTIIVNGTFHEDIVINKSISLFGVNDYSAVIQGYQSQSVVSITANSVHVKNFTITKDITGPDDIGIRLASNNSTVENNKITNINSGFLLALSSNNRISKNFIFNKLNYDSGISLYRSNNNVFSDNIISNNTIGVSINQLSNNNFNGSVQVTSGLFNYWSVGDEGNYWSNYLDLDSNNDGVGDQPYVIDQNNQDSFPLMGRFSAHVAMLKGKANDVTIVSNSTISDFSFDIGEETGNKIVSFVSNEDTFGFCRIMIPTEMMSYPYVVLVSGEEVTPNLLRISNETTAFLYFIYTAGNQTISVIS